MSDQQEAVHWLDTLAGCVELDIEAHRKLQADTEGWTEQIQSGVSNWRWPNMLSVAEQKVFGIDPDDWPRCAAALNAYMHFNGECMITDFPVAVYEAARRSHAYILDAGIRVEAFAEFAYVFCGLDPRNAHAAYTKQEMWHFHAGRLASKCLTYDQDGIDAALAKN